MNHLYNPGVNDAPAGSYREVGPRGGEVENARTVEIKKGDRLPATQASGNKWMQQ